MWGSSAPATFRGSSRRRTHRFNCPQPRVCPDPTQDRHAWLQPLRHPRCGGRVTAVAGFPDDLHEYVQGASGGGVWHTDDAGHHWWPKTDDALTAGAVVAVAVAEGRPDVIYVGTGSACIRGNVSVGRGAWKSEDGGETWDFIGLPASGPSGRWSCTRTIRTSCTPRLSELPSGATRSAASIGPVTTGRAGIASSSSTKAPGRSLS